MGLGSSVYLGDVDPVGSPPYPGWLIGAQSHVLRDHTYCNDGRIYGVLVTDSVLLHFGSSVSII